MFWRKTILLAAASISILGASRAQEKKEQKPSASQPNMVAGKEMFRRYWASCHGESGKGDGPAATALTPRPPDLTTLARRREGKYPEGYVGALLMFGRNFPAHGSEEMPVWGSRFKQLDPVADPTGQQHVNDVVAYVASLQAK